MNAPDYATGGVVKPTAPKFTFAEAERAAEEWGCNCGPTALAAILDLTLEQVREALPGFDAKRYTNPTMMFSALDTLGATWSRNTTRAGEKNLPMPRWGLARIQWGGPWTRPGVPMAARYRYTHWVGSCRVGADLGVFDVNALENGSGWCAFDDWVDVMVPLLTGSYPRADGSWWVTQSIEVER